ncbi:MAG: hydroxyacylglutathione hydrolase [Myxococcota bacterium]
MRVIPVPCLRDNYAYLVVCDETGEAAVVDPSEAAPVLRAAAAARVRLSAIWNTHHHGDHTGGNADLAASHGAGRLAVVGHASDRGRIPEFTVGVEDGDEVRLGALRARVLHVPGHTLGALTYLVGDAAFTGDTLFLAGCGRLFEGTPAMMFASLAKLATLPPSTRVFCGHEYTRRNLAFAREALPGDENIRERAERLGVPHPARRDVPAGEPTVPGTIAEERATNLFLRAATVDALAELRRRKDAW